jgi:hypothetical protein
MCQFNAIKYVASLSDLTETERKALEDYVNSDQFEWDGANSKAIDTKLFEILE